MPKAQTIKLKRVYEPTRRSDGTRFLVDRLWPRGMGRATLHLDGWLKEVAPSDALRRWVRHDPARGRSFECQYRAELNSRPQAWKPLIQAARRGPVTLLSSARDTRHNNAVALRDYRQARMRKR